MADAYTNTTLDKKKLSKKDEKEIVDLLGDYFQQALADIPWREARDEMVRCFDYKENRQWTTVELAELARRNQPPTVNNQVKVTIDRIVGQFVQVKSKTVYKPRNGHIDDDAAAGMSDIYSYIRQSSGLEFEERDVVEDGATGGFGVFDVCVEDDGGPGQEVKVKAEDCFNIFPDPKSRRYDWNEDARYICRAKWVDQDYAKELYPKKAKEIESLYTDSGNTQLISVDVLRGEIWVDYNRNRIRLVEVQYKKFHDITKYIFSDGKVMLDEQVDDTLLAMAKQAGITWQTKDDREEQICIGVFCAGILFEHGVSKRKRYSFVPYFTNRKKSGAPYSMITTAIPLQDAINKRESKALHLLTTNQAIYERGVIGDRNLMMLEMAKPDGAIELEEGGFEKFRVEKNLELANTQFAMHGAAKLDFRQVTGVNPDALGEKSEVRSGVGIQRKIAMTGLIIAPIFDNFRRTREALAKTIHDAVTIAYTSEKIMLITDNPKLSREVFLSNDKLQAIKQAKYDVIISEEHDFDTVQEQQLDILSRSLPNLLQFGPAWAEVLLEMSSIRDKDVILAKVQKITQASAPKKDHNISFSAALDKLTVPEKIFLYQEMGMPPQLIAAVAQNSPPPTQILDAQAKQASEQAKLQAENVRQQGQVVTEQHKHALEQTKLQGTVLKAQTEQQKSALDIGVAVQKGKLDLIKKQMELTSLAQAHNNINVGGSSGE
jgi:hypothetical protein